MRRLRVSGWFLSRSLLFFCLFLAGTVAAGLHYRNSVQDLSENQLLREENVRLRSDLKRVRERVAHIGVTLDRVEHFDQKLRALARLSDPERHLAIGPVGTLDTDEKDSPSARAMLSEPVDAKVLVNKLDTLQSAAERQESSLQELESYFEHQNTLLASMPSLWPARGWVTSDFGHRVDPFTAERIMHRGLDIGAAHGTPIKAPSDGRVIFAGVDGNYGKVLVLDHGYGVKTRYAHMSELAVKAGDEIKRGERLGAIGNTGRSTGPHLHYEVRINGVPENPRKFILE
jgi:murein DD-endopeptidase MepM/ murein hydrolase activator NlpD